MSRTNLRKLSKKELIEMVELSDVAVTATMAAFGLLRQALGVKEDTEILREIYRLVDHHRATSIKH